MLLAGVLFVVAGGFGFIEGAKGGRGWAGGDYCREGQRISSSTHHAADKVRQRRLQALPAVWDHHRGFAQHVLLHSAHHMEGL